MRNMRKIIASILVLVMMLSLSLSGFAYYTGSVSEDATYSEKYIMALNTLYGLGVIPDNTPKDYEADVTRAQFAEFAGALLGGRTIENVPTPVDQKITLGEAVQILVDGTENTIRAEKYGYMGIAGQMGITHGLVRMQSYDNLTYGAVIQILYNSMRITPGDTSVISSNGAEYEFDSNRTVLTEYLDVEYKKGFVTADGFWSLNPGEIPEENEMVINGQMFTVKYPGLDDYVGFYVNYYYSEKEDMILAVEKSSNGKQVILDSDDVRGYRNNTYTYYSNGTKQSYKIADGAYIINNFAPDMATDINMYPAGSDIVLTDANGDNEYETVFIKTYTGIRVGILDADDYTISAKGGVTYKLSEDIPARVWLDGAKVSYANVTADMYASLVIEPADNPENRIVREIYLSSGKVSGEVTSIAADDTNMKITIGDTEYDTNLTASDKNKVALGMKGDFLLNFKGEIACLIIGGGDGGFGYLMQVDYVDSRRKNVEMKLLAADGTFPILAVSDKCKVDNETPDESIFELFTDEEETIQQLIWYETNSKGEISKITLPLADDSTLAYGDYRLHKSIDNTDGTLGYLASASLGGQSMVGANTVVFNIPKTVTDDELAYTVDKAPISKYCTVYNFEKNAPFADAVVSKRTNDLATSGDCGGPGEMIPRNSRGDECIVISCKKGYVEEYDGYYDLVEFVQISTGKIEKKILADNAKWLIFSNSTTVGHEIIDYIVGSKDLKPGDIFNYRLNLMGEIGTVHKFYDASDESLVKALCIRSDEDVYTETELDYNNSYFSRSNAFKSIQCYAVDSTDDYLIISENQPITISEANREDLYYYSKYKKTYAYEVTLDGNNTEAKKITFGQIKPNDRLVITQMSGGYARLVTVYKDAE